MCATADWAAPQGRWRAARDTEADILQWLYKSYRFAGKVMIIKAATLPDHVYMYVSIPSKVSVSKTMGRIKGKSALMIRHPEYCERNNLHFWARGYYCETVGNVNEETIKNTSAKYERDRMDGESVK